MNTMSVMQSVPASEAIPMTHQPSVSECLLCQNTFKTATGTDLSSLITKDTHCHEVLAHLLAISSSFQSKEANKPRVCGTCLFQLIKYWEYHQMIEAIRQDVQSKVDLRRIQELYPPLETPDVVSSDQKAGPKSVWTTQKGVALSGEWREERWPVESAEFWRHLVGHDETKSDILLRTKILRGRFPKCLFLTSPSEEGPPKTPQIESGESSLTEDGSWHFNELGERPPKNIRKYCCASKYCGLTLWTFIPQLQWDKGKMEQLAVELLIQGNSSHEDGLDKTRTRFEMTRQEFFQDHICEFCCEQFTSESNLNSHLEIHEDRQNKDQVGREDNALSISRDMSMIYPKSPFTCPVGGCEKRFATFQSRNLHYLAIHTSDAPYKCKKCDKRFKVQLKFKEHIKKCILGQRYSCELCPKVFMSSRNLRDHVNVIHSAKQDNQEEKAFSCPRCPKRFHKRHNLKYHMVTHSAERAFTCTILGCNKSFKRERALKSHKETLHAEKRPSFLCVYCGRNFDSFTGMKTHTKLHTGEEYIKRKVSCPTCQKKFQCPSDLKIHSVVHTKEKPFVCHICQASFSQRASLKEHTNVHLNVYQCSHCLRAFGRERYLQSHLKTCHSPTTKELQIDVRGEGHTNPDEPFDNVSQAQPVIHIESYLNGSPHDSSGLDGVASKKMAGSHVSSAPGSISQEVLLVNQAQVALPESSPHASLNINHSPQFGLPSINIPSSLSLSSSSSSSSATASLSSRSGLVRKIAPLSHPLPPTSLPSSLAPSPTSQSNSTEVLVALPSGSGELTMIHYVDDEELATQRETLPPRMNQNIDQT